MSNPKIGRRFIRPHAVLVKRTEESPVIPPPEVGFMEDLDPETAAEDLLGYLPEDTQGLIREAQRARGVPLWQMLMGYVMHVAGRSELFTPFILTEWEAGMKPTDPRPCHSCSELFVSRFPGAMYCCSNCHFMKLDEFGHTKDCPIRTAKVALTTS